MRAFLRYLGSPKNLIGVALALVGVVLHVAGLFGPFWPLVVVALYAAGALIGPRRRPKLARTFDQGQIRRSLDQAYQMTHGRLPADAQRKVGEIRQEILALLPYAGEFPPGSRDLYVIERMAVDYLPGTIRAYLALPPDYAERRMVGDGRTPLQVMTEQLDLLDAKMDEITEAVRQRDSDRLLANGLFLEERFGRTPDGLRLPRQP